jgi:argininosuccinate lyase
MSQIRGRFQKAVNSKVAEYTASIPFDWRLYPYDIAGSIAHARMLARQGIITESEAEAIVAGLNAIQKEIEKGKFRFSLDLEDIHMNIEARLIENVGEAGRKLHTARSRNDQVALDMRLFTIDAIVNALGEVRTLQRTLVKLASANKDVIIPGYTHLQMAQPVLLAHHLLAYFEMLQRDYERFSDCLVRADVMPLGSGALAGVTYPIDREGVAAELGFNNISRNSLDAVSDRDFVIDYEAAASVCMMHLSRLAEEMVLWSSAEFGFIEIDEAYATGSSIMPQKRNPDVAELARGKTGRTYGHLIAMLTTMKGLPLAYNKDLQEDKEGLFDTADTLLSTLDVFNGMVKTLRIKAGEVRQRAESGYMLATDLADYLVKKGEAFRTAYDIVARLVSYAVTNNKTFDQLRLPEYKKFSSRFGKDVYAITVEASVAARDVAGGTAPGQVDKALKAAKKILGARRGASED